MVRAMTKPYGITLDREWTEWAGEQPAVHVQSHARKRPARRLASNSSFALMQSLCPLNAPFSPQRLGDVPPPPSICWPITAMAR